MGVWEPLARHATIRTSYLAKDDKESSGLSPPLTREECLQGQYNKPDEHSRGPRENLGPHPRGLITSGAVNPAKGSYGLVNHPAPAPAGARVGG